MQGVEQTQSAWQRLGFWRRGASSSRSGALCYAGLRRDGGHSWKGAGGARRAGNSAPSRTLS
eukprot:6146405-Lingulodinium_polyedra.AAC.1